MFTIDDMRRSSIELTIADDVDIENVEQIIRKALSNIEVLDRVGGIRAISLTHGAEMSVRIWHDSRIKSANIAIDASIRAIRVAFDDEGIRFAPNSTIAIDPVQPPG